MKKFFAMAAIALFTMVSCSDDDSASNNNGNAPIENILIKKLVDTYEDGSTTTTNFIYNGNNLVSFSDTEGYVTNVTYNGNGNRIAKIIHTGPDFHQKDEFIYDSQDRVFSFKSTLTNSDYVTRKEFTYNADNTVTVTTFTGNSESQTQSGNPEILTISGNNNIMKITEAGVLYKEFTYANTIDPWSNITGYDVLSIAYEDGGTNNITSFKTYGLGNVVEHYTTAYTYNSNNFPATSVEKNELSGEEVTTQYFYE